MSIYLKIPNVDGNVSTNPFNKWIKVLDLEFPGVKQAVNFRVGAQADRQLGFPSFSPVVLLKELDNSSTKLFEAVHEGTVFDTMEFNYVSSSNKSNNVYAKLILSDVMLTGYSEQHSHDANLPREAIRLVYTKMQRTFIPRDSNNNATSPVSTGFNLETAQAM